jgi:HPt (histidine-containing phosphotransfer) domain-containing protein
MQHSNVNPTGINSTGINSGGINSGGIVSTGKICSEYAGVPQVARVLADYVASLPPQVARMADALAHGDRDVLRRLAHQLHGTGGSYGFPQVTALATDAESAIRQSEKASKIAADVRRLIEMVRRIDGYDPAGEVLPGDNTTAH